MSKKISKNRLKWKETISKWQSSGKTAFTWCRENNINNKTFYRWRSFFSEKKEDSKKLSINSFVEISNKNIFFEFEINFKKYSLKFKNVDFSVVKNLINYFEEL